MKFISTRGGECVTGAQAIARGIAADGGLFVPETFPEVTRAELSEMLSMSYAERAAAVLHNDVMVRVKIVARFNMIAVIAPERRNDGRFLTDLAE